MLEFKKAPGKLMYVRFGRNMEVPNEVIVFEEVRQHKCQTRQWLNMPMHSSRTKRHMMASTTNTQSVASLNDL